MGWGGVWAGVGGRWGGWDQKKSLWQRGQLGLAVCLKGKQQFVSNEMLNERLNRPIAVKTVRQFGHLDVG